MVTQDFTISPQDMIFTAMSLFVKCHQVRFPPPGFMHIFNLKNFAKMLVFKSQLRPSAVETSCFNEPTPKIHITAVNGNM